VVALREIGAMLPLSKTTSHDSVGILVGICLLSSRSWRNKTLHPARGTEALADIGELRIASAYFLLDLTSKNGMHFSVSFSQTRRQLAWQQRWRMRTFGKTRLLASFNFPGGGHVVPRGMCLGRHASHPGHQ
jgi:hypothetical protein